MIVPIMDKNDFNKIISSSKVPVFAKFFASWCGPCKIITPIVDNLSKEFEDQVKFIQVDIDICQDIAQNYFVMSVPSFLIFKDGEEVDRFTGASDSENLKKFIEKSLS